jgi:ankyrin repeat protein
LYPRLQGADTEIVDRQKRTALLVAAESRENQFQEVIKLLIRSGANVDARDSSEETALHWAARAGDIDLVRLLISKKARVSVKNSEGKSALDLACAGNNSNVIELLLKSGATCEPDTYGRTELHEAIQGGCNAEIVRLFVSKGVNVNAKDNDGFSESVC